MNGGSNDSDTELDSVAAENELIFQNDNYTDNDDNDDNSEQKLLNGTINESNNVKDIILIQLDHDDEKCNGLNGNGELFTKLNLMGW